MVGPTYGAVNRRHLLGVAGAGSMSLLGGLGHSAAAPRAQASAMAIVPERLRPTPSMQLLSEQQADLDAYVADASEAFHLFAASLSETQRQRLLFPIDGVERTAGPDTSQTPAFCAVLLWCEPGWGLTLGSLTFAQRTAFEGFLAIALGAAGYETVSTTRNCQNLIGVLEDSASTTAIEAALKADPARTFDDLSLGQRRRAAARGGRGRVHRRHESRLGKLGLAASRVGRALATVRGLRGRHLRPTRERNLGHASRRASPERQSHIRAGRRPSADHPSAIR
jgi:hypothetical protein